MDHGAEWFRNRMAALQSTLDKPVIIIPGVDGGHNQGSQQLIKFLFLGESGLNLHNCSIDDDELEELVLTVSPSHLSIFCIPPIKDKVLQLSKLCANVTVFCQNSNDYGDTDADEVFKINSFAKMVYGYTAFYVTLPDVNGTELEGKNKMAIEQWPLIQAYALEDWTVGGGNKGFFTMKNKVFGLINVAYWSMLGKYDSRIAGNLYTDAVTTLSRHWGSIILSLDSKTAAERTKTNEDNLVEPLLTYFLYGCMSLPDKESKRLEDENERPKIIVGRDAPGEALCGKASSSREIGSYMGAVSTHFVVEAQDPLTSIRAVRTYFLSNGGSTQHSSLTLLGSAQEMSMGIDKDHTERESVAAVDTRLLISMYTVVVELTKSVIESFCYSNKRRIDTKEKVLLLLQDALQVHVTTQQLTKEYVDNIGRYFHFHLSCVDAFGRRKIVHDNGKQKSVLSVGDDRTGMFVCLAVTNIPSTTHTTNLGTIKFGDSFLYNFVEPLLVGDDEAILSKTLVLTERIPILCSWPSEEEAKHVEKTFPSMLEDILSMKNNLVCELGDVLLCSKGKNLSAARMADASRLSLPSGYQEILTGHTALPRIRGRVTCFEKGLVISDCRYGCMVISFDRDLLLARFCDGDFDFTNRKDNAESDKKGHLTSSGTTAKQARIVKTTNGEAVFIMDILSSDNGTFRSLRLTKDIELASKGQFVRQKQCIRIAIAVQPKTTFGRSFLSTVIPAWKTTFAVINLMCETISGDEIPEQFIPAYTAYPKTKLGHAEVSQSVKAFLHDFSVMDRYRGANLPIPTHSLSVLSTYSTSYATTVKAVTANSPVYVYVLTGLPGSGKYEVATALIKLTQKTHKWYIIQSPAADSPTLSSRLTAISKTVLTCTEKDKTHAVLVVTRAAELIVTVIDSLTTAITTTTAITAHTDSSFVLVAVTVVIAANNFFVGTSLSTVVDGLLEQCVRGYTNTVVLRTTDVNSTRLSEVQKTIDRANSTVSYINVRDNVDSNIDELLTARFQDAVQVKARLELGVRKTISIPQEIFEFSVPVSLHLDGLESLAGLCVGHTDKGTIYHVRGLVNLISESDDSKEELHDISVTQGRISATVVNTEHISIAHTIQAVDANREPELSPYLKVFTNNRIDRTTIAKSLIKATRKRKDPKSLLGLSLTERKQLRAKFLTEPALPSGYCFNGNDYVDNDGKYSTYRPDFEQLLEKWVVQYNKDIEGWNLKQLKDLQAAHVCFGKK